MKTFIQCRSSFDESKSILILTIAFAYHNMTSHSDQGRRHNFESGGYKYYCERSEQNFFGLYPHICNSGGYNSYKERHTESLSDSIATISYWSCSCNFSQYLNTFQIPGCHKCAVVTARVRFSLS